MESNNQSLQIKPEVVERIREFPVRNTLDLSMDHVNCVDAQPSTSTLPLLNHHEKLCKKFECLLKNLKYFWPPGVSTEGIPQNELKYLRKHASFYISKIKGKNFSRRKHSTVHAVAILNEQFSKSSFLNHETLKSLQRKTGLSRLCVSAWFKWKRKQFGIKSPTSFLQSVYKKVQFPTESQKINISAKCGLSKEVVDSWFRVTRALENNFVVDKMDPEEMILWRFFTRNHHKGGIKDNDVDLMSDILVMPKSDVYKIFLCWSQRFEVENHMNPNTIQLCNFGQPLLEMGQLQSSSNMSDSESHCELEIETCEDEPTSSTTSQDVVERNLAEVSIIDEPIVDQQAILPSKEATTSCVQLISKPNNKNCSSSSDENTETNLSQKTSKLKTMPLIGSLRNRNSMIIQQNNCNSITVNTSTDSVSYAMSVLTNVLAQASQQVLANNEPPKTNPIVDFSDHSIIQGALENIREKQSSEGIPKRIKISKVKRKKLKHKSLKSKNTKVSPLYFETEHGGNLHTRCKSYPEENKNNIPEGSRRKRNLKNDTDIIFVKSFNKYNLLEEAFDSHESDNLVDTESDNDFMNCLTKICQDDFKMQTSKNLFCFNISSTPSNSDAIQEIYQQIYEESNSQLSDEE